MASHLASMRRREEEFWWASFVRFEDGVFNGEKGVFVGRGREVVHRVSKLGLHTAATRQKKQQVSINNYNKETNDTDKT
jgi:hypothetical protein